MVQKPALGVVLCFQETPVQTNFQKQEGETLEPKQVPKQLFFMKQYAANACGTIAIFHITINKMQEYKDLTTSESYFQNFRKKVKEMDPETAGKMFEESKDLMEEHKNAVHEGDS